MLKKPEIIVFAGPNGSGKSTITKMANIIEPYVNADDIKRTNHCTDLEAAQLADKMRYQFISESKSFTFETVLSTERKLDMLKIAKQQGFFIRCIYVLTADYNINVLRVKSRKASGGHDVATDKIIKRYERCMNLLPELLKVCDICHVYDNSDTPFRILKKRKDQYSYWENEFWDRNNIEDLVKLNLK
ncbi:hypothetical protein [Anaerosinus gibii]|uniref:UDP-N-acetylglucosamine kinase n=1 Tax=Selenobaculum gibii TaxID=3054208 RepID=A0A9Y2ESR1_9FIRM|nr:hypothetical protein [Selenobaculum gbiensis]WIW70651.1 hypothetical protein P3F81_12305 [Selenobaculum gbiensis]